MRTDFRFADLDNLFERVISGRNYMVFKYQDQLYAVDNEGIFKVIQKFSMPYDYDEDYENQMAEFEYDYDYAGRGYYDEDWLYGFDKCLCPQEQK